MPKIILWNRAWKPDLAARKKGKKRSMLPNEIEMVAFMINPGCSLLEHV